LIVTGNETRQRTIRLAVSETLCSGHGRCYTLSPDVFHADDDGFCAERGTDFDVGSDLEQQARLGVDSCPEGAITIVAE
jgi:ferredoxin